MTKYSKLLDLRRLFDSRAQDFALIINEYWLERSHDILNLWQNTQGEGELDAFYELCVCAQALKRQDFEINDVSYQVLSTKIQQIVQMGLKKHFLDLCSFFSGESWVEELKFVNEKLDAFDNSTEALTALDEERIAKYHSRLNALWQEWEDAALMLALLVRYDHQHPLNRDEKEELVELIDELNIAQNWVLDYPKSFSKIGLHISAKAWAMKNRLEDWDEEMYGIIDVYLCVLDACYGV